MNSKLQRDIIAFLTPLTAFENERARRAILLTAGLEAITYSLELSGSAAQFVALLVERLDQHGVVDGAPALARLLEAVGAQLGADQQAKIGGFGERLRQQERVIAACPYRGLDVFREEDARFFFGRDADQIAASVPHVPFLAVIGASGSGKSSLVFAGALPRLRRQGKWRIADFRPLASPFLSLASAALRVVAPELDPIDHGAQSEKLADALRKKDLTLAGFARSLPPQPPDARLLLVIDQFEELFAPENEAEVDAFVELLLAAARDRAPAAPFSP